MENNTTKNKEDNMTKNEENNITMDKENNITLDKGNNITMDKENNITMDKENNITMDKGNNSSVYMANLLYNARMEKKAIPPLTETFRNLDIDSAYDIQMINVNRCIKEGQIVSGKKIGLTSEGIQKQMGVNEPDYGHLFSAMDFSGTGKLPFDEFIFPKIEGEVAFHLVKDLYGGNVTADDVLNATDYIKASFEIVDSRISDWKIKLIDTVADNASSGAYILGKEKVEPGNIDLINLPMKLYRNGKLISEGKGSAVLGDPCRSVAWLSNRLHDYGVILKAGEIILSGAFTAAPPVSEGDEFEADFGPLGSVSAEFI